MKQLKNFAKSHDKGYLYAHLISEKPNQSGRSMVEMLGVLAIIGILSVMGVAGYMSAMNKNKANTLLEESNRRAVVIAGQISLHHRNPSLNEFDSNGYLGYAVFDDTIYGADGTAPWTSSDEKFSLKIKFVSKSVCQNLQNIVGGIVQSFDPFECSDDATIVLGYNNDLSTERIESSSTSNQYDDNAGALDCSTDSSVCDELTQTCTNGKCVSLCASGGYMGRTTGCVFMSGSNPECTSNTDCSKKKGCCVEGACAARLEANGCPEKNKACTSNMDCDTPSEYCSVMSNTNDANSPNIGTCLDVDMVSVPQNDVKINDEIIFPQGSFIKSTDKMTWWSADNWCKAQGKRLVSLSDLGLPKPTDCTCSSNENCGITNERWEAIKSAVGEEMYIATSDSCIGEVNGASNKYSLPVQTNRSEASISALGRVIHHFKALCK